MADTKTCHRTDHHEIVGFVALMRSFGSDFGATIKDIIQEGLVLARDIKSRSNPDHQSTSDLSIDPASIQKWLATTEVDIQSFMPVTPRSRSGGFYVTTQHFISSIISRSWDTNEILNTLELRDLHGTSDRLRELCHLHEEDPDEPVVVLESLWSCAQFFLRYPSLDEPQIGLTPDGLLLIEWTSKRRGAAAIVFRRSGLVQFAAVSKMQGHPNRFHGESTIEKALESIRRIVCQSGTVD